MMSKNRKRHSQKAIKEAFCSLLCEKPIDKIFVKEICEQADYSTMAFYASYEDKYDLARKIVVDEALLYVAGSVETADPSGYFGKELTPTLVKTAASFFNHVKADRQIYECIFSNRLLDNGITYFAHACVEPLRTSFKFEENKDQSLNEYTNFFIEQTITTLLNAAKYWLESDFNLSAEALAELYVKFKTGWLDSIKLNDSEDSVTISFV